MTLVSTAGRNEWTRILCSVTANTSKVTAFSGPRFCSSVENRPPLRKEKTQMCKIHTFWQKYVKEICYLNYVVPNILDIHCIFGPIRLKCIIPLHLSRQLVVSDITRKTALTWVVKEKTLAGSTSSCHEGKAAEKLESEIKPTRAKKCLLWII